jgi:hypothetical protein
MQQYDLIDHIDRQKEFSIQTFGPNQRTPGILDHIRKELKEIENNPSDLEEWIDVIMLAIDGAWRVGHSSHQIVQGLIDKLAKNKSRKWPDWRNADPNKAIEHDRNQDVNNFFYVLKNRMSNDEQRNTVLKSFRDLHLKVHTLFPEGDIQVNDKAMIRVDWYRKKDSLDQWILDNILITLKVEDIDSKRVHIYPQYDGLATPCGLTISFSENNSGRYNSKLTLSLSVDTTDERLQEIILIIIDFFTKI